MTDHDAYQADPTSTPRFGLIATPGEPTGEPAPDEADPISLDPTIDLDAEPLIEIDARETPRMRVSDMRHISAVTGMDWEQLFTETDLTGRFQILVFWKLRQRHRQAPAAELWKIADDAEFEIVTPGGPLDPTAGEPSPGSPNSAATGA